MALRIKVWMRWVWAVLFVSCALAATGCGAAPSDSTPSPFLRLHNDQPSQAADDDPDGGQGLPVYPTNPSGDPGDPQQ